MLFRFKLNFADFIAVKDFEKIKWDELLTDFQKKTRINYIDFDCAQAILTPNDAEALSVFLECAESLNITCSFYFPQDKQYQSMVSYLEKHRFHRCVIDVNDLDRFQTMFSLPKNKTASIVMQISITFYNKNLSYLNDLAYDLHIHDSNQLPKNNTQLGIFLNLTGGAPFVNAAYQHRWPYYPSKLSSQFEKLFLQFIHQNKFINLRKISSPRIRLLNKLLKGVYRFFYLNLERLSKHFVISAYGIQFFKWFHRKNTYSLETLYPLTLNDLDDVKSSLANTTLQKKISSSEYTVTNAIFDKMNGSIEWQSGFPNIKTSTVLTHLQTPGLIKAQFSGIVDFIGFYLNNKQYIVCKATKETQNMALNINANGSYTLIKDGAVVAPLFSSDFHTPARISNLNQVGLVSRAIVGSLITQQVGAVTSEDAHHQPALENISYSILVVCTRFSRRLQQLLNSICTQKNYPLEKIQVIVCYVPGIDGTDDLMDSLQLAYPKINFVRKPFSKTKAHHKGHMINQAALSARGERCILTDADIIFPPDLFTTLDQSYSKAGFVGSYARKMLTPKTTAQIMLGQLNPQTQYQDILKMDQGELRIDETGEGRPIGFFQLVKKEYLLKTPYQDLPNFEGADNTFAEDIMREHEKPTIANEITLLHLDHGGSQWYGTQRHM